MAGLLSGQFTRQWRKVLPAAASCVGLATGYIDYRNRTIAPKLQTTASRTISTLMMSSLRITGLTKSHVLCVGNKQPASAASVKEEPGQESPERGRSATPVREDSPSPDAYLGEDGKRQLGPFNLHEWHLNDHFSAPRVLYPQEDMQPGGRGSRVVPQKPGFICTPGAKMRPDHTIRDLATVYECRVRGREWEPYPDEVQEYLWYVTHFVNPAVKREAVFDWRTHDGRSKLYIFNMDEMFQKSVETGSERPIRIQGGIPDYDSYDLSPPVPGPSEGGDPPTALAPCGAGQSSGEPMLVDATHPAHDAGQYCYDTSIGEAFGLFSEPFGDMHTRVC